MLALLELLGLLSLLGLLDLLSLSLCGPHNFLENTLQFLLGRVGRDGSEVLDIPVEGSIEDARRRRRRWLHWRWWHYDGWVDGAELADGRSLVVRNVKRRAW